MTNCRRCVVYLCGIGLPLVLAATSHAQQPVARDTLTLGALHEEAVERDARSRQIDLLAEQSALRRRSLDAERLPALSILGQAQYQSDVATIPFELPGGNAPPTPPRDTYDAHVDARQPLYNPSLGARRALEDAQLAESQARVRASLYDVRRSVDNAFFTALLLQTQTAEVAAGITVLEAQLIVAGQRVDEGAALPSEAATLEAELLRRRQMLDELTTGEGSARRVLGDLTGLTIDDRLILALPDLRAEVANVRTALDELRARPEYERFDRSMSVIDRQQETVTAQTRPRVSAYGRAGYGRPGLNPLASDFATYWLTGVQVEWTPWSWGSNEREREVLALQEQIIASEEAAFTDALQRSAEADLAEIDRLERALESDDAIIALREQILSETGLRIAEGVITSAEFVDRETDLLEARLARAGHRVQLAQARAGFLTLTGVEIR